MRTSAPCHGDGDGRRPARTAQRPRRTPVSEVAAVWLLPLLGVAVLALVWLV
jgi:hypothetical protein